jgi:hypothetical protein
MGWKKRVATVEDLDLDAELAKIREVAPPPPDDAVYMYLRKIYRLRITVGDDELPPDLQAKFKRLKKTMDRKILKNYFRVIIEATAGDNIGHKVRWKYSNALSEAYHNDVSEKSLKKFIRGNGGINKTSEIYTKRKKKAKKG